MKLLIVDDQLLTLNGIAQGLNWREEGFDVVETAQNAMEARISFSRAVPDVMLCDIEMPVENGVELCRWVRQQRYGTEILFLTCHTDFIYAQEAIQLRASDFIVQPAPYHEIREKVHKVVESLREKQKKQRLQNLGSGYSRKQDLVNGNLWRGFLVGTITQEALAALPGMPDLEKPAWLVLQQLCRWHEPDGPWRKGLLIEALRNFLQDVFLPDTDCTLASYMEYNTYAIVIQPGKHPLTREDVASRLKYLSDCYDVYMPCCAEFYLSELHSIGEMSDTWEKLLHCRDQSAPDTRGIHYLKDAISIPVDPLRYLSQKQNWLRIYQSKGSGEMARNAKEILENLRQAGALNRRTLNAFQFDWLSTIHEIGTLSDALDSPEGSTLLRHSVYSMEDMCQLIAFCVKSDSCKEEERIVPQIVRFIQEHVYSDIRKDDITNLVHLNSDYVTRIFKKETGYSIKSYIIHEKMLAAKQLLQTTSLSVGSVAMQLGYNNFSHFSAAYKKEFGISPGEEKRS